MRHILALVLGLVSASSSVIFIKASHFDPVLLAAGRLLVAAIIVAPWFLRALARHRLFFAAEGRRTLLPGAILGVHFVTWIIGARLTPAVNSSLLVNMVPLVTPFLLRFIADERLHGAEWFATTLAFAGVVWLAGWDYQLNSAYFVGDAVCFGSMLLFATYMVLGRRNRDFPSIWLYMWPVYVSAAAVCVAIACFQTDFSSQPYNVREFSLLIGLGILPTILGHGSINFALRKLRGQVVGVANLAQVVSAGFLAYVLLGETPHASFFPASLLIAGGVWWVFRRRRAASAR